MSGGQRQRIAIARAFLADPRVLILDDATSSVDATTEREIKAALREVMEGRTTFVIAHRLSTIALADDIVVLEQGRVIARGTHDELLDESPLYAEIATKGLPDQVFLNRDPIERVAGYERARLGREAAASRPATRRDDLVRRWRATSGRGRKLRGLAALLAPYRAKVILMFVSLLIATAAALAPPPLAKLAIDNGIVPGDMTALTWIVVAFMVSALVYWGATYAQTYLVGWIGQRALQDLRIQLFEHLQGMSVGFYSRKRAGVLISRMSNDVEALDTLVSDGIVTLFGSSLTLIGTAAILFRLDPELALITYTVFPVLGLASLVFRIVSADAYRATREKVASITGYLQETLSGHPRRAHLRAGAAPPAALRGAQRGEPRREHEDGLPQRRVLPGRRADVRRRDRRDPALRRHPGGRRRDHDRRPGRLPGRAEQLLRPDPAAQPALHDLPVGHGGAGQDLRAARRGARPRRRAGRARAAAAARARSCSTT